jgi:hypothetical protein
VANFILPARGWVERGAGKADTKGTTFHRAYHGSPHDFDRFDSSKIGSGEGAQAYGHGLYFAGKKDVAEYYKRVLSPFGIFLDGKRVEIAPGSAEDSALAFVEEAHGAQSRTPFLHAAKSIESTEEYISEAHRSAPKAQRMHSAAAAARAWHRAGAKLEALGRIYEVELAPAEEEYLDWDKPLTEQSAKVREAIAPIMKSLVSEKDRADFERYNGQLHRESMIPLRWRGETLYQHLVEEAAERNDADQANPFYADSPDESASRYLASLGIPGIKYLDGSSRARNVVDARLESLLTKHNGSVEAAVDEFLASVHESAKVKASMRANFIEQLQARHHNYVIFDDKHVEVRAKFARTPAVFDAKRMESLRLEVLDAQDVIGAMTRDLNEMRRLARRNPSADKLARMKEQEESIADQDKALASMRRELAAQERAGKEVAPLNDERRQQALFARTPDWITDGPEALKSAASKIDTYAPAKPIKEKVRELATGWQEKLVQGVFDAYAPLKRLGWTEYVKARMVKSADGALEGMLLYGKPMMSADGAIYGDIDRKGFLGAMKELHGEHDRFFMWVAGQRAGRLMAEGREHLFTADEIRAMKSLADGKIKDGAARTEAYAKAAETLRQYNAAVLDIAEKTGLIDGESRHLWEHDFYVPFFRMNDDAKIDGPSKVKGLVRQQAFKKLTGGEENLGDLMANTLSNWSHLLSASMANQAAVSNLKAAEKLGIAREVPAETKGATFAMVEGEKVHYEVDDPFILTAISAMESAQFKGLPMEIMGKFKHYLTLGVTVSPTFRIRNLLRDSIAAIGQNEVSYNALMNVAKGYKGTSRKGDQYAQMLFNGALMRFGQLTDGKHAEHAKRLIAAGVDDQTILTGPEKVKAALGKLWDEWQEFGDRMENVNRAALYEQLKKEGKSDIEAAFAARDMMDFSLQGSWVAIRFLSQIVPFQNARLQGMYKLGRAVAQNPARLGYVAGATALASIALLLAYEDDDDWKKREDWDRDTYWWFKIGDVAFRIPKPFEIGAIGTLAERSVELAISDEMTGKRFKERLQYMLGQTFAMNPTPQMFKPMLDIYANIDSFTGRQIETLGMENLSKSERLAPGTSLVARFIGKAGETTGLSPVQVDHLLHAYFGWLGSHVAMTADMMAQPFMDAQKPARKLGDYLVVGDFVEDLPANQSRYVEEFYKQAKAVHEVMGDLRVAREAHDAERVKEILEEHRSDVALANFYTGAERRIGEIGKRMKLVQASGRSAEEKREALDRLTAMRNEIARVVEMNATRRRESAGR